MQKEVRVLRNFIIILALIASNTHISFANPTGGSVAAGSATINSVGNTTTITQTTDKAAINWATFNITNTETTNFIVPNSTSITLNRIGDISASTINGNLTSNGRLILINPNGFIFNNSAVVNAAGVITSFADMQDANFMAGIYNFDTPGSPTASITNNGNISSTTGGFIYMLAPSITNNASITSLGGNIKLYTGQTFQVDLSGNGSIVANVDANMIASSIQNNGTITANSAGSIDLRAAKAQNVANNIITNTGTLRAKGINNQGGVITLFAEGDNAVTNNISGNKVATVRSEVSNYGVIDATPDAVNGSLGGTVRLFADTVYARQWSTIDVSGNTNPANAVPQYQNTGGTIYLGGGSGTDSNPTSLLTSIENNATLTANGGVNGDGGSIYAWSDNSTYLDSGASLSATGGSSSGNGGYIQLAGVRKLDALGSIDTSSPTGTTGTLYLRASDINISTSNSTNVTLASPFTPSSDNTANNFNVSKLSTYLNTNNVTLESKALGPQLGDLTLSNALTYNTNALTLKADHLITSNAAINGVNTLSFISGAGAVLNAAVNNGGTGHLLFQAKDNATSIGIAGASGTYALSSSSINNISSGWNSITIGSTSSNANVSIGTSSWNAPTSFLTGNGNINLTGTITSTYNSAGTNFVLATIGGHFVNTAIAGANAINPGIGRFLLYSSNIQTDTLNGLTFTNRVYGQTYNSYGPGSVVEAGNVGIFGANPVLYITPDSLSKTYGSNNPALTYSYSGLVAGDLIGSVLSGTPSLSTAATASSNVGTYNITASAGSASANLGYVLDFSQTGTLTINPASLTITANNTSKTYGANNPAFSASYSGFINGDTSAVVSGLNLSSAATSASNVGTYSITGSGASASNYNISYTPGTLTINPASLTITANNASRTYGTNNPAFSASYSGFVNGDTSAVVSGLSLSTIANINSAAGTYSITPSGASASNYNISYNPGILTITALAQNNSSNSSVNINSFNPNLLLFFKNPASQPLDENSLDNLVNSASNNQNFNLISINDEE
jgi:filamentous hemagglutinin family protein